MVTLMAKRKGKKGSNAERSALHASTPHTKTAHKKIFHKKTIDKKTSAKIDGSNIGRMFNEAESLYNAGKQILNIVQVWFN